MLFSLLIGLMKKKENTDLDPREELIARLLNKLF